MSNKIKVLIVDDSALVRKLLTEILGGDRQIEVVGTAAEPYAARNKIKALNPDVITLDVEMPKMDGLTFLEHLMRLRPMPVVMVSSLTEQGADTTMRALELGAVDFVTKPKIDLAHTLTDYADELRSKVKTAAGARVRQLARRPALKVNPKHSADAVLRKVDRPVHFRTTDRIVAIGASTGGTEAIKEVLLDIPADSPIIVIAQHIPESFSLAFANRLDKTVAVRVSEARDGQQLLPGHAYVAPGGQHFVVKRNGARYVAELNKGPAVNRHRPSVDVLFRSVAQNAGPNAIGVLLTGMGDDGAAGLLELKEAGAPTIAQDKNTSVVWGMPGEAVKLGAAMEQLPLQNVAARILEIARGTGSMKQAG